MVKEPDLDPKQRRIKDFLLRKSQPTTENSKAQETEDTRRKKITRGPLVVPF